MGYMTRYDLEVEGATYKEAVTGEDADGNTVTVYVIKTVDLATLKYEVSNVAGYDYVFSDQCKWYGHDNDMKKVSKQYPDVLFILSGEGEESGDLWRKYYKNGKVQVAEAAITYEAFDESKLK